MPIDILGNNVHIYLKASENERFLAAGVKTWALEPPGAFGTIDEAGMYVAPDTISKQVQVYVVAKCAPLTPGGIAPELDRAVITLSPEIKVVPEDCDQPPGDSRVFTVEPPAQEVDWSITPPSAGTITAAGAYTATSHPEETKTVVITATRRGHVEHHGNATVHLMSVSFYINWLVGYWIVAGLLFVSMIVFLWPELGVFQKSADFVLSPPIVTLGAGQRQQFTATSMGAMTNGMSESVTWQAPEKGMFTNDDLYIAPAVVTNLQYVTIHAISKRYPNRCGSALVVLSPEATLSLQPALIIVRPSQIVPFATSANDPKSVQWRLSPTSAGSLSSAGIYEAPEKVERTRVAMVTVTITDKPQIRAAANLVVSAAADSLPTTHWRCQRGSVSRAL